MLESLENKLLLNIYPQRVCKLLFSMTEMDHKIQHSQNVMSVH